MSLIKLLIDLVTPKRYYIVGVDDVAAGAAIISAIKGIYDWWNGRSQQKKQNDLSERSLAIQEKEYGLNKMLTDQKLKEANDQEDWTRQYRYYLSR